MSRFQYAALGACPFSRFFGTDMDARKNNVYKTPTRQNGGGKT